MKKIIYLFAVIVFTFGMNVNAQDIAMVDNSKTINDIAAIEKISSKDDNVSPEIQKLKAEFLKEIKQKYFLDNGLAVPRSLEIILISDRRGTIKAYFSFSGKMGVGRKSKAGTLIISKGTTALIKSSDKEFAIYQK
ncbi:MAG: hypothetical protein GKR88_13865 [Flavobacteriaceae bacterium]|nr:MAG: hypothetical protein GKR88_13865 [Flavobacteriaceae bacterium]